MVSVREQLEGKTHNTSAIPAPAMKDTCEFLEEELEEIYLGAGIKMPINRAMIAITTRSSTSVNAFLRSPYIGILSIVS